MNSTIAQELYSHSGDLGNDFDNSELDNVADIPAYKKIVADMKHIVRTGWKHQRPPHLSLMTDDTAAMLRMTSEARGVSSIYDVLDENLLPRDPARRLLGCVGSNCTGNKNGEPTGLTDEQVLRRPWDVKTGFIKCVLCCRSHRQRLTCTRWLM